RRATTVGGGLSLLFHAGLLALLAGRSHVTAMGELTPPAVTIDVQATTLGEPAPAPAPAAPSETKARGTIHSVARRAPKVLTSFDRDSRIALPASPDPGDPGEEDAQDQPPPPPPVTALAKVAEEPAPPPTAPVIAADTARALRVYDTYPMLLT